MGLQHDHFRFNDEYFDHYYLCHYQPLSKGSDELSRSLLRFKNRWPIDLNAWTECSVMELKKLTWTPDTLIVRSLQNDEMEVSQQDTSLDKLGQRLAEQLNLNYSPDILVKTRMVKQLKLLAKVQREEELDQAYRMKEGLNGISNILLIDDISTSGTTVKSIITAIRANHPNCNICVYTLAQTNSAEFNAYVDLHGLQYHWEPQEGWVVEEDLVYYVSVGALKDKIMKDFVVE